MISSGSWRQSWAARCRVACRAKTRQARRSRTASCQGHASCRTRPFVGVFAFGREMAPQIISVSPSSPGRQSPAHPHGRPWLPGHCDCKAPRRAPSHRHTQNRPSLLGDQIASQWRGKAHPEAGASPLRYRSPRVNKTRPQILKARSFSLTKAVSPEAWPPPLRPGSRSPCHPPFSSRGQSCRRIAVPCRPMCRQRQPPSALLSSAVPVPAAPAP